MSVKCGICPNNCIISENKFGICGVRSCRNGEIYLPFSGKISASSIDPIEKKPLYHFHPGRSIYSVGFFGCSLSCPFCQNYRISKEYSRMPTGKIMSPADVAKAAFDSGSFGIAYTYSEPIVHHEWVIECADAARSKGLKNVLVTNGYINRQPAKELLSCIDAVNIDLKSFSGAFYRDELGGSLEPVLDFIRFAADSVHTELTTLVITGKNDSINEIEAAADFIADIDINIPWHLSAYYPSYKYTAAPTDPSIVLKLAEAASEKLNFIYAGNIRGRSNTRCPSCGNILIRRDGYSTAIDGIKYGCCSNCGSNISEFGIII